MNGFKAKSMMMVRAKVLRVVLILALVTPFLSGCGIPFFKSSGQAAPKEQASNTQAPVSQQSGATATAPSANAAPETARVQDALYLYYQKGYNNQPFTSLNTADNSTVLSGSGIELWFDGTLGNHYYTNNDNLITSVTVVMNNFTPYCYVNLTFFDINGGQLGTAMLDSLSNNTVKAPPLTAYISVCGTDADTSSPSPQPWAFVGQMTDSAGNTYTYEIPPSPPPVASQ